MPDQMPPAPMDAFADDPVAPDSPFVAIGDVHGRRDLLAPLLDRLHPMGVPVVLLGDYIDHGPDSAGVLRLLQDRAGQMDLICLRGNHEELLIRFLHRPRRTGRTWLRFGGRATLESFGIHDLPDDPGPDDYIRARDALIATIGDSLTWMKSMPYWWQSGNVAACHAGADPHQPLADQMAKAMVWGHPDFGQVPRADGVWCVHGHRIVPQLQVRDGVISIDTGAWKTGLLCAALIGDGDIRAL
ncbi:MULTISPECIES: metallophosphoesterase [unclassified Yoonia]|uniref:metallophosphoesterase n=1 Tax=unclassified Yoonia TaxID=2629118 RepID=UPI002AFE6E0E|nr:MULTISPECIES: metallophosphoesterase [unclassified Yoonia]